MTLPTASMESKLDTPLKCWIPVRVETLVVLVILLLAVVSRFVDLGVRAISHDEVNHVIPAYSLYSGQGYSYDPLSHGPLQFHMMALSYALFGDNDFTSRIPAAVFSVAAVAVAMLLFRRYLGRVGALAAGLMMLISPYMLFYGRYERNEAFIVLWGLLTLYAILRYLEKGEKWVLILYTLVNALHFTDKATAYIFAAEELIFLAVYFVDRLSRREWPAARARNSFLGALSLGLILLGAAGALYFTEKPLGMLMKGLVGGVGVLAVAALVYAGVVLVRALGWGGIRAERSFDLLMLLGTLILPLLAALPDKLAGFDPQDYSTTGLEHSLAFILPLMAVAIALGLWWKGSSWFLYATLFYFPLLVLYTTFFTNPVGLAGGFMGALGYWMIQERGDQPLYYYALLQIPMYEFLPAVGTITAALIAISKRLWQSEPGQPFTTAKVEEGEVRRVPTVALTVYWSVSSLVAFSVAGEKMPWLTTHIAMPMILAAGWAVGWLVETAHWGQVREWASRQYVRAVVLAFLGLLAILTARAAWRAAYINYDNPLEFLVYAHSTADTKQLLGEIEELSRRTTGGLDMVVAYDNMVRYNYWWYLRHYPNRIDFDVNPTLDLRRALVIAVGAESYSKIVPVVRNDYNVTDGMRLWWPMEDYFNLKWDSIASERAAALGPNNTSPMTIGEYVKYAWRHIRPFFTDSKVFSAVWQIWFNRDYTEWAALKNSDAYTLTNWGVSDRMRYYVRKDIASQIWTYSSVVKAVVQPVDPYQALTEAFTPDAVLGGAGAQPGQFQAPRQIALAADGSLYVADSGNNRIQHLSVSGQVLGEWGSFADATKGAAPGGTFNEPWGVAVGPNGNVYVADTWNHRIQEFTSDGKFIRMWGTGPGLGPQSFYGPRGVVVDSAGRVLVADTGNKRIVIFDANGGYLGEFGSGGSQAGELDEPVGLALGKDGRLYVTDTWNQRVQVFAPDASGLNYTSVAQWTVAGWVGQSAENKPFIAVGSAGEVFVSDPEACRVIEFNAGGNAQHVWGGCGVTGGFTLPDGLVLDQAGGLWVGDAGMGSLIHFNVGASAP